MTRDILQKENAVLRTASERVLIKDIKSKKIKNIISEMKEALAEQRDGVGLAAPQIGYSMQIFIVSKKVVPRASDDLVFINPKITKFSKKKKMMEEGCLSVRWIYGNVERSTNVTLEAYDENGEKVTRGAGGLLAHIFQHEVDHLNGILFIDKAVDTFEGAPPEEETEI